MKIIIKHYNIENIVEIPEDCTIEELFSAIIGQLVSCGWGYETIISHIMNRADEENRRLNSKQTYVNL